MRPIDADVLIEELGMARECKNCPFCKDGVYCRQSSEMVDVCEAIDEMPTLEAVPVVRCKDCVYWGKNFRAADGKRGDCMNSSGAGTSADHFCAYGERKKEERNGTV